MTLFFRGKLQLYACLFCLASLSLQTNAADKPLVVSSIRPLNLLVQSLAGDVVRTEILLQAGDSPHHLALRVSQLEKLQEADLVVWVGPEFERFLLKPLRKQPSSLSFIGLLPAQAEEPNSHIHGEQHLWLHPTWIYAFADALSQRLEALIPQHSEQLKTQTAAFKREFAALEQQLRQRFASSTGKFIAYHPAFNEYVSAYNLNQIGSVLEGSEHSPSLQRLAQLKKIASEASCLLADSAELEAAKRYATLLELTVKEVDVLGVNPELANWFEYYTRLSDVVLQCLQLKPQTGDEKIPAPSSL